MKALHLWSGNLFGGVERLLLGLGRYSDLAGMQADFGLCFSGQLSEQLQQQGSAVHFLGNVRVRRPWTLWLARRRLRQLLCEQGYDAVVCHACWPHALFAPVVRGLKIPLVHWAHDIPNGKHWLERWAARTPPDLVLANSRFTYGRLSCLFPQAPSEVQYLPAPPFIWTDREAVRLRTRARLQTPESSVVIMQTSRLERWKGHGQFLEVLSRLRENRDWTAWILAQPQRPEEHTYLQELTQAACRLHLEERVRWVSGIEVSDLLASADVHCQPNLQPEPFGVAFVEALQAGLPVVTTAQGGACEIVDETCGILTPPGQPAALAEALLGLLADPQRRARLAAAGPSRAAFLCDPGKTMTTLAERLRALKASGREAA